MSNDGLQQIMQRAVVISGDEQPPVNLDAAEAVAAFAHWLTFLKADGSVGFDHLARLFIESQGWAILDQQFLRRLREKPQVAGRSGAATSPAQPQGDLLGRTEPTEWPESEPVEVTDTMKSPAGAVIISGGVEDGQPFVQGDHFLGDEPRR